MAQGVSFEQRRGILSEKGSGARAENAGRLEALRRRLEAIRRGTPAKPMQSVEALQCQTPGQRQGQGQPEWLQVAGETSLNFQDRLDRFYAEGKDWEFGDQARWLGRVAGNSLQAHRTLVALASQENSGLGRISRKISGSLDGSVLGTSPEHIKVVLPIDPGSAQKAFSHWVLT